MKRFNILKCLSVLTFVFLAYSSGFAALTSANLTSTKDTYLDSRYASTPHGTYTTMSSSTYLVGGRSGSVQYYRRSYVAFDVSSIPSNAVIYSATLDLTRTGSVSGGATWKTKLLTSSWLESMTSSGLPTISNLAGDVVSTTPNPIGYVDAIDVTSMVQRMVYGQTTNFGWSVELANEAYWGTSGAYFYTRESGLAHSQPNLNIKYYIPLSVNTATTTHESAVNESDGGVSFTLSGGASTSYTYAWYAGTAPTTAIPGATSATITDLPYGWYGVHVTGTYGEDFYQAFIVGTDCREVTITFQPDLNYTDNAYTCDIDRTPWGGINYITTNFSTAPEIRAIRGYYNLHYEQQNFLNFKLWMDDELDVTQADLFLQGLAHMTTGGSNAVDLDIITQPWLEHVISWDIHPTSSTSTTVAIPATTSLYQNNTVDMIDFWDAWKANNNLNYGFNFKFQSPTNNNRRHWYHSPLATTVSTRPSIEFKVSLLHPEAPYYCNPLYAAVERKLTGVKYKTQLGLLYFYYNNEYTSASSDLTYKIYEKDDQLNPIMDGTISTLPLAYGRNDYQLNVAPSLTVGEFYILEVKNDKDELFYLRFEML